MFYSSLSIKGFGPHYKRKEFNFHGGVNVITGENGTGKSTVFDAIQWCLYGPRSSTRSLKERDSVINDRSHSAHVELSLFTEFGSEVVINRSLSRSKKHSLSVHIDGDLLDLGINETQEEINNIIGDISPDVFSSISMMVASPSHSLNKFISGSALDRRRMLASIMDPENEWEKIHKELKKSVTAKKKDVQSIENSIEVEKGYLGKFRDVVKPDVDIDSLQTILEELKEEEVAISLGNENRYVDILTDKIQRIEREINTAEINLSQETVRCGEAQDSLTKLKEQQKELLKRIGKQEKIESEKDEILDSIEYQLSQYEHLSNILSVSDSQKELSVLAERIIQNIINSNDNILSQDEINVLCRVNGKIVFSHQGTGGSGADQPKEEQWLGSIKRLRPFIAKFQESLSSGHTDENIQSLRSSLADIENSINHQENVLSEIKGNVDRLSVSISDLEDDLDANNKKLQKESKGKDSTDGLSEKVASLRERISEYETTLGDAKRQLRDFEHYTKEKEDTDRKIESLEEDLEWERSILEGIMEMVSLSSPAGLISSQIGDFCEQINSVVNDVYSGVFNRDMGISVESSAEEGESTCLIFAKGRNIETYSHGEQSRMIMAILCAMTKVFKEKTQIWIPPLWDEPTMSIDDGDSAKSVEMLEILSGENMEQCLVISREDAIVSTTNDVVYMTKK